LANSSSIANQSAVGFTIPVPAAQFNGSDADGTVQSIRITAFPKDAMGVNVASITINGVKYNQAAFNIAFPGGATIPANGSGNPLQAIGVQGVAGNSSSILIPYVTIDNGGAVSATANVTVPFSLILPVTFGNFYVTVAGCTAAVNFETLTELNSQSFIVESSANGFNWATAGILTAKGSAARYSFNVATTYIGLNYYRIKQVDKDGSFQYSSTVTITNACRSLKNVSIYPNPVKDQLNINGLYGTGNVIVITDAQGRELAKKTSGSAIETFNTSSFGAGIYVIKISNGDAEMRSFKVVKN